MRLISTVIKKVGRIRPRFVWENEAGTSRIYQLHSYTDSEGNFDYEKYRRIQAEGNRQHLGNCWVLEDNVKFLAQYLRSILPSIDFGICHGTRAGKEQAWFRQYLQCQVVGTEISDTANMFEHTVQWDFHKPNPAWTGNTDFIYSNSLDHSYDPEACLNTWMDTLKPGGVCILEHSNMHAPEGATELDPFGAELCYMPYLIAKWSRGRYYLRELIEAPCKNEGIRYLSFLVLQKPIIDSRVSVRA